MQRSDVFVHPESSTAAAQLSSNRGYPSPHVPQVLSMPSEQYQHSSHESQFPKKQKGAELEQSSWELQDVPLAEDDDDVVEYEPDDVVYCWRRRREPCAVIDCSIAILP